MIKNNFDVDIVIAWVDSSDPKWLNKKNKYLKINKSFSFDSRKIRYRDWGLLKYIFRGIEKFAPWVHRVYFISDEQIPPWINESCPKLKIVDHRDYIPKKYLPTFSANPIELNLHRIKDLSEHFIYFNDDTFLTKKTSKFDFFSKEGLPKYPAIEKAPNLNFSEVFCDIITNNINKINSLFHKREVKRSNFKKWYLNGFLSFFVNIINDFLAPHSFIGIYSEHIPSPFLKSEIVNCWNDCFDVLDRTSKNKFRSSSDVNQYLFKYYLICKNRFSAVKPWVLWDKNTLCAPLNKICKSIESSKKKIICINDEGQYEFKMAKSAINNSFKKILPYKSNFEK